MLKKLFVLGAMLLGSVSVFATDVNTASAADLDAIKGIGPALSAKIISERENGKFKDWEDLKKRVKGIGNKNAVKLSEAGLTVGEEAYPGAKDRKEDAKPNVKEQKKAGKKEKTSEAQKTESSEDEKSATEKGEKRKEK